MHFDIRTCAVNWQTNNNNMSSRFTQRRRDLAKIKDLTRCLHRSKRYQVYGVLEVFGLLALYCPISGHQEQLITVSAPASFSLQADNRQLGNWRAAFFVVHLLLFLDHGFASAKQQSMLATFLVITGQKVRSWTHRKLLVKVAQKTHFTLGFVSGWVRYDYCCCSLFLCVSHPLWL